MTSAMTADAGIIVVLTNFPDRDSALLVARRLVEARLAACVNVLDGCTSVYRWNQKVESQAEVPVLRQRLVDLYTAWDKPADAKKWQEKLDQAKAPTP